MKEDKQENKIESFFDSIPANEEKEKELQLLRKSKSLRILCWRRIVRIAKETPKDDREAAIALSKIQEHIELIEGKE